MQEPVAPDHDAREHDASTALADQLEAAWARSDALFGLLTDDALFERPIQLRHPFVFYLGHLPAFAWNQVGRGLLGQPPLQPPFDDLFERGIDPLDDDDAQAVRIDAWPAVHEILAFRDAARQRLRDTWEAVGARATAADADDLDRGHRIHHVVLEHELMHHETLLYMFERLDPDKRAVPSGGRLSGEGARVPTSAGTVVVPAGRVRLGARLDQAAFAWGNELDAHDVDVPAFEIDRLPVTIAEWRRFVDAGGYRDEGLWDADAWAWLHKAGITRPATWVGPRDAPLRRTMLGDLPLEQVAGWPVQVSHAEARAWCRWRGRRLPTEAELARAAYADQHGVDDGRRHPWGDDAPGPQHGALDFTSWHPLPVGSHPAAASALGVQELVGNGWEWTDSPFAPFDGFRAWVRTYPGYSTDFFDGAHRVLLGGSWATAAPLLRRSFRNWFQVHYPYVFSKFRTVGPAR